MENLKEDYLLYSMISLQEGEKKDKKCMRYGLPEKEKFPLYDEKHVRLACRFFSYAEGADREKLARAIKKAAKEFGMKLQVGKDNPLAQYLPKESIKENQEILTESVLDPVHKTRSPEIFDTNDQMLPEVKKFIQDTYDMWFTQLNPENKIFDLLTFKMIGSLTGFAYSDTSDCDIQIFLKMKEGHSFDETRKMVRILPNGHNIPGTLHPVNFFFVDIENPTELSNVENLYDLYTGVWEKKTEKPSQSVPILYARQVAQFFMDGFDLLLARYDRDKGYLQDTDKLDPNTMDISEKEKQEAIDRAVVQLKADIDSMRMADHVLHGLRTEAYQQKQFLRISIDYMTTSVHTSMNEFVYKVLDRFEYRTKLWDRIDESKVILEKYKPKSLEEQGKTESDATLESFDISSLSEKEKKVLKESIKKLKKGR